MGSIWRKKRTETGKIAAMDSREDIPRPSRILALLADSLEPIRFSLPRLGFDLKFCHSMDELIEDAKGGVGALLIHCECLDEMAQAKLEGLVTSQEVWSQIPILLIGESRAHHDFAERDLAERDLSVLGNVSQMGECAGAPEIARVLRAAIVFRHRQYKVRDLLKSAETSQRAKSDFLANMSHEIRTPLGAVLGFSELLIENGVNERERDVYMTAIRRNGQMLSALIDDILDLAKVESGRIEVENIEFSIKEVLSEVVSNLEPRASKKSIKLEVEVLPDVPDLVVTDPIRLKQILLNVVGNAVKFTGHGAVTVRISAVSNVQVQSRLHIEVEDTGIGISSEQTEHLFKPFSQGDSSRTRRYGGTGLGLVLSRKLAQAMGGALELKWSIAGGGSCFAVDLPVGLAARRAPQAPLALIGSEPLEGRKILVVDDSIDNQMLITRILKLLGADVESASDGQEAVDRAMEKHFDIILMDLQMPRMGGVEATRVLRSKGYRNPIVALTAHTLKEDRQRCLSVGCTDYLTKPIERTHLVQVLERVAKGTGTSDGQPRH